MTYLICAVVGLICLTAGVLIGVISERVSVCRRLEHFMADPPEEIPPEAFAQLYEEMVVKLAKTRSHLCAMGMHQVRPGDTKCPFCGEDI